MPAASNATPIALRLAMPKISQPRVTTRRCRLFAQRTQLQRAAPLGSTSLGKRADGVGEEAAAGHAGRRAAAGPVDGDSVSAHPRE